MRGSAAHPSEMTGRRGGIATPALSAALSCPRGRTPRSHPGDPRLRARDADPDAFGPRRRHGRDGLHAAVPGRHAHRREEPDARHDLRRDPLLHQLRPALPAAQVAAAALALSVGAPAHAATIRVALERLPWPVDPALADGRDETTLARTLFA